MKDKCMNNLCKKLVILAVILGYFGSVCAMEKEPLEGTMQGLPTGTQRRIALSMIGDFLLNQQRPKTLGHEDTVYATDISPDSKHIVTGSFDGSAKKWDRNGNLECILKAHKGLINLIAISPDNVYLASASFDKSAQEIDRTVKIWDMRSCRLMHILGEKEITRHLASVTALAISPDNSYIVTGSADHTIKVWDLKRGQLLLSFGGLTPDTPGWTDNWINDIKISADSVFVSAATNNGEVILLHAQNGRFIPVARHVSKIIAMALAGNKLVTGSWDGTAKVWDADSGQMKHIFGNGTNKVLSVDISHDGAFVAVGPADAENVAKVYDANTGQLVYTLGGTQGHKALIKKVKISSDNKFVATASQDNTVKVWSLTTGALLYTFVGHTKEIESLKISPDVRYVVSGSWDHTAKIWDLLLNLNAQEFNEKGSALAWIKNEINIFQANLIARAYAATQAGKTFVIKSVTDFDTLNVTDDMYIWLTMPKHVRDYLIEHLNIQF